MSIKQSAGILLYRFVNGEPEVLLVHPGGPFWAKKDLSAWSIPKGEFTEEEDALVAARREFKEETGTDISGNFTALKPVKQKSGKIIYAWAIEGNMDANTIVSNTFEMEWPPRSGKKQAFPEIDRGEWFGINEAKEKINAGQLPLIEELMSTLK